MKVTYSPGKQEEEEERQAVAVVLLFYTRWQNRQK